MHVQKTRISGTSRIIAGGTFVIPLLPGPARPKTIQVRPSAALIAIGACCARFRASVVRMKSDVACAMRFLAVSTRAKARLMRAPPMAPADAAGVSASCS